MRNRLGNRWAVAGIAVFVAAGVSGCGDVQTVPRKAGHLTLDGATRSTRPPACSQDQQYRTIDLRDRDGQVEAVVLFDKAAAATSNPVIADSARLKSAFALLDTAPYDQVEARLQPLMDSKRPFHALAREALGMAQLNAGRTKEALSDFQALTLMEDAPQDVRERAQAAITLIKAGTATGLPATVKAAMVLPPLPPQPAAPPAGAAPDQSTPAGAAQ